MFYLMISVVELVHVVGQQHTVSNTCCWFDNLCAKVQCLGWILYTWNRHALGSRSNLSGLCVGA